MAKQPDETSEMLPTVPYNDDAAEAVADNLANDVINLQELINENEKATPTTTNTVQEVKKVEEEQKTKNYSLTPTTSHKLSEKRPANLTLNIFPNSTKTNETKNISHLAETDNFELSASSTATIVTPPNTASSIFPHENYKTKSKVNIGFENISYSTRVGFLKRENKDILIGINGLFRSGELNAIVGPSGAGKSTLLNLLSGYTPYGYSGQFRVNDKFRDLKAFKPNVALIRQDTSMQAFLSVNEAMHFAANLKLGRQLTKTAKRERVRKILECVGLYDIRHTSTGNLSGGQKKRLAIALEFVSNPPVLILDEPTTGLDSSTTTQLVTLLKTLAEEGCTVICTIHQPSALVLGLFDHLYAIAEGQCIYAGATQNLVPYLAELDLFCPESYNPLDYLMEIATHDYGKQNHRLVAHIDNGRNNNYRDYGDTRTSKLAQLARLDKSPGVSVRTPPISVGKCMPSTAHSQQQHPLGFRPLVTIPEVPGKAWDSQDAGVELKQPQGKKKKNLRPALQLDPAHLCKRENIYATPFHLQLGFLLWRTFLLIWRDNSLTTLRFAIHLITGLLIGFIYYGIGNDAGNAFNNFRYTFYAIMFIMYSAFSGILVKFPLEFPIVSREHFNRWYSLRAYYIAITLADIPIQIICTSLFIFPTYLLTGQPLEFIRISLFFLIIFMTALVAQSIGLAVGAALSLQLGCILGPFFICPFLQFSGFFLTRKDAPFYLRWCFDISFLKYSLDGAALAIFGFDRERLECNDIYCHYSRPKYFLKSHDMSNANYEKSLAFMFGLFVLLRIIAFYIMSFRLRLFKG